MTTIQRSSISLPFVLGQRTGRCIVSLMLLVFIVVGLPTLSGAQQTCQPDGDIDQNGSVTAADALLVFQQALGLAQLSTCQRDIADVFPQPTSPDGNITASDALCIFQKALSLPSCLDNVVLPNEPPVAITEIFLAVEENTFVTLSGSGLDPDGTIAGYHWVQTIGTTVALSGADAQDASFTAPEIGVEDVFEDLVFELTVTDDDGASGTDVLIVTVYDSDHFEDLFNNELPTADAGPDQTVDENTLVTLSGSGTDLDGDIAIYEWTQISGTTVDLIDPLTPNPSFTAPDVDSDEELVFELAVWDDAFDLGFDTVTIRVVDPGSPPEPPVDRNALEVSVFGAGALRVASGSDQLDCAAVTMCQGVFEMGNEVVIEANPDSGWAHERWVGCDQDSGARCTVFMDGDHFVSVAFRSAEPPEVEDHVIHLQADQLEGLVEYDVANGVLVFESDTAGLSQWAIGDILLSGGDSTGSDDRSMPFARRILDIVSTTDSRTHVHTIQASLDDIFSSGSLSYRQQGEAVTASAAAPGSVVVAQSGDPAFPNKVAVNLTFLDANGQDVVTVTGTLGLSVEPEFDINFGPLEARFVAHARTTGSLALDLGSVGALFSAEKVLPLRIRLAPITIFAGPIPVVITPVSKLFLTVRVNVSNPIQPTVTYSISTTVGAHYKSGHGTKPVFSVDVDPGFQLTDPDYDLVLTAETGVRGNCS